MEPTRLTLYGRSGCHLCEDMERALRRLAQTLSFSWTCVDIDGDAGLGARYGERIPVLNIGDREICHYFLDEDALRRALADAQAANTGAAGGGHGLQP